MPVKLSDKELAEEVNMTPEQLAEKYGGWWGEHPLYGPADWESEAFNGDTRLGYWSWVQSQLDMMPDQAGKLEPESLKGKP